MKLSKIRPSAETLDTKIRLWGGAHENFNRGQTRNLKRKKKIHKGKNMIRDPQVPINGTFQGIGSVTRVTTTKTGFRISFITNN